MSSSFSKNNNSIRVTLRSLLSHRISSKFEGKKYSSSGVPNGGCDHVKGMTY
jgi:hypothetical protein